MEPWVRKPAIFANWADWDVSNSFVRYREFGAEARISWGTPLSQINHSMQTDVGSFQLVLHLNTPPGTTPPSQNEIADQLGSLASNAGSIFIDTGQFAGIGGTAGKF